MREALEYVEACGLVTTAEEAAKVWKRIQGFAPAMVLFSTQIISEQLLSGEPTKEIEEMISKNLDLFHQISEHRQFKCCRGPAVAKHMRSSEIVSGVKPLMTQKRKKQKKLRLFKCHQGSKPKEKKLLKKSRFPNPKRPLITATLKTFPPRLSQPPSPLLNPLLSLNNQTSKPLLRPLVTLPLQWWTV